MTKNSSLSTAHAWALWGRVPSVVQSSLVRTWDASGATLLLLGSNADSLEQAAQDWQGQLSAVRWHVLHAGHAQQDGQAIAHRVGALQGVVLCMPEEEGPADFSQHVAAQLHGLVLAGLSNPQSAMPPLPIVLLVGTAVWWQFKDWLAAQADVWLAQGVRLGAVCVSPLTTPAAWQPAWMAAVQTGGAHDASGMSPLSQCLGMELHTLDSGKATVGLCPRDAVRNSFGVAHGGALMSLMDVAMALAARSFDMRQGVVTVEMKSSFMRAADLAHGHLQAVATVLHRTATLAFCEVSVRDGKGHFCAHGTGTFKILPRLASGHRTVHGLTNAAD